MAKAALGLAERAAQLKAAQNPGATSPSPDPVVPTGGFSAGTMSLLQEGNQDPETKMEHLVVAEKAFSYLTLPSSKRRIKFYSTYIPPGKLSIVEPDSANVRLYDTLTDEAVDDILPSIIRDGITFETWAAMVAGRLYLFDGARRLYSAIRAGKGLPVRYTREVLTEEEKREVSMIANKHRTNSLCEKGLYYRRRMADLKCSKQSEFAAIIGEAESIITEALKAADIPSELYRLFPSSNRIGRPRVMALHRLYTGLTGGQQNKLIEMSNEMEVQSSDKAALELIATWCQDMTGEQNRRVQPESVGKFKLRQPSKKKLEIMVDNPEDMEKLVCWIRDNLGEIS